jgi:hypothetical protein
MKKYLLWFGDFVLSIAPPPDETPRWVTHAGDDIVTNASDNIIFRIS